MSARDNLAAAVAAHGPFPMPVGTNPGEVLADVVAAALRDYDRGVWDDGQIEDLRTALFEYRDRTPAPAAVAEEELDTAQLRLALASAKRGRSDARAEFFGEQAQHRTTVEQRNEHVRELVRLRARVAELEALKPARFQDCQVCGAGYEYGQPCTSCEFTARMAAETAPRDLRPATDSPKGAPDIVLCRCGHGAAYHDAKYSDPQCRLCPEDGERMWRHPFTPAEDVS